MKEEWHGWLPFPPLANPFEAHPCCPPFPVVTQIEHTTFDMKAYAAFCDSVKDEVAELRVSHGGLVVAVVVRPRTVCEACRRDPLCHMAARSCVAGCSTPPASHPVCTPRTFALPLGPPPQARQRVAMEAQLQAEAESLARLEAARGELRALEL